jgi:hypothetical protein
VTRGELRHLILKTIEARGPQGIGQIYERVRQALVTDSLDSGDRARACEAIWELVAQQVLIPGPDHSQKLLNDLTLTDYGREVFERVRYDYLPYDPDGYLREISKRVRGLDGTARMYLAESLQAFNRCLPLASAVMLGAASEQLFLVASEALAESLDHQARKDYDKEAKSTRIKPHFDAFLKDLRQMTLPKPIADNLDQDWAGIFNLIRNNRNDAGHPARPKVDLHDARTGLLLFPEYCERAVALTRFLRRKAAQQAGVG